MSLPLLEYKPTTQNQRVRSFGIADWNEDTPYRYQLEDATSADEINQLIWAAYRQVFNEQEILTFNRQTTLETRLKNRSIRVRDFIRGLAKSERFYRLVVEPNNNYRLVQLCFQRFLGRSPYNQEEEIAWSGQLINLGWEAFVDRLIDSDEYSQAFGDQTVPYQRKRVFERPFSFTPRYGADYRDKLPVPQPWNDQFAPFDLDTFLQRANWPTVAGLAIATSGLIVVLLFLAAWTSASAG
jgi:phycobilisome rod-core linker protein